jgi:N-methylhydantoinase B
MHIHYGGSGHTCAAFGLAGADAGAVADHWVEEAATGRLIERLANAGERDIAAHQVWVADTGGGGGLGDPLTRDPESVADDVSDGFVTVSAARERYGVVLRGDGPVYEVDVDATTRLREERRAGS